MATKKSDLRYLVRALSAINTLRSVSAKLNMSYEELLNDLNASGENEISDADLVEKYSNMADSSRAKLKAN